jgi:hypothetical protein
MFDYISYQTTVSIAATPGQVYASSTEGAVYCAVAAAFIFDVATQDYTATSPNCGGNNGEIVKVRAPSPPKSPTCDGTTTNIAVSGVSGGGSTYITDITVTTTTDNILLIDLLGGPMTDSVCSNKPGSSQWCYDQNYKAAIPNSYTGKSGNIDWNYNIFCGAKLNPDIATTVPQKITCP